MSNRRSQITNLQLITQHLDPTLKHILEFGVWKGSTIKLLRNLLSLDFIIYGFDSFDGLPEDWTTLTDTEQKIVAKKTSFNLKPVRIPQIENVELIVGEFKKTLPLFIKQAKPISLLHIDCDLYSSTKEVLFSLNEFIVPNTIIVFDEWIFYHDKKFNDGEQKAFYEWVNHFNRNFQFIDLIPPTDSGGDVEQRNVKILK